MDKIVFLFLGAFLGYAIPLTVIKVTSSNKYKDSKSEVSEKIEALIKTLEELNHE